MPRPYDVLDALGQLYKKFGFGELPPPEKLAEAVKSGKWITIPFSEDGTGLSAEDVKAAIYIVKEMSRKPDPNSCPGCGGLMRDGACVLHITEMCPP